jgi:hypothetical protein
MITLLKLAQTCSIGKIYNLDLLKVAELLNCQIARTQARLRARVQLTT